MRHAGALPSKLPSSLETLIIEGNFGAWSNHSLDVIEPATGLQVMVVHEQVSGSMPPDWADRFPALRVLDVADNRIGGKFPDYDHRTIEIINAQGNDFDAAGTITAPNLRVLNLAKNRLPGFPVFQKAPSLEMLDLHSNRLVGAVPTSIFNMALQMLKLQNNELSNFPQRPPDGLKALRILDISHNKLKFNARYLLLNVMPPEDAQLERADFSYNHIDGVLGGRFCLLHPFALEM